LKNYIKQWIRRWQLLITVVVVVGSAIMPFVRFAVADAALITTRSIAMSSSAGGATGTSYKVSFNLISTGALQGIVVDFCDNDPVIGDTTCTTPAGFSVTASPAVSGQSATAGCSLATFTTATSLNSSRSVAITASAAISVSASPCAASFTLTTITNPSTANHTFYARVYSYATAAAATSYTSAVPGAYVDAGGIALSTAAQIVVTAKVQEQLTFCVYTGANCAAGGTAITLGTNGVLSTSTSYTDINTSYDIQTNATGGAAVYVKGGLLTSGSNTIPALTTAATYTAGTSEFGICTYRAGGGTNLTPYTGTTLYSGGTSGLCSGATTGVSTDHGAYFYYGTTAISGTYGDEIASEIAGTSTTGNVAMMAGVSNTQVAGIYTTTLTFIAVGTY
jgi:hypothetical protein